MTPFICRNRGGFNRKVYAPRTTVGSMSGVAALSEVTLVYFSYSPRFITANPLFRSRLTQKGGPERDTPSLLLVFPYSNTA